MDEPVPEEMLPNNFHMYDGNTQLSIIAYIRQLNSIERKAYLIGKEHLGTSFNVVKSNGYCNWIEKQNKK